MMTVLIFFLLGLCVGSFLNVLADRLPRDESVFWGRSHCDYCKKPLRWYELIPVVSFVLQAGRCRRCRKKLSLRYPLIELITGAAFVMLPAQYWVLFSSFLVIFIADFTTQIIPDSMLLAAAANALVVGPHFLSAVAAGAFFYMLWFVTRGRGMGFGDVKLAAVLGLFLGYTRIIVAVYAAFLTGAAVGVILMLAGKKGWKSKIAFGPFLILGTVVSLLWNFWSLLPL